MITHATIALDLYGEPFRPTTFGRLTGVTFDAVIEKDVTVLPTGRYNGKPAPYGSATLRRDAPAGTDPDAVLASMLRVFMRQTAGHLPYPGLDTIDVWVTLTFAREGQYGWRLGPVNAQLLGQLNATLLVNIDVSADHPAP